MSRRIWWVISLPRGRIVHATLENQDRHKEWESRIVSRSLCGKLGFYARGMDFYPGHCPRCYRAALRRGYTSMPPDATGAPTKGDGRG